MTVFQPADNLRSRTFLGLLIAQFLAAFNDQAIHASAMFFAINTQTMSVGNAISLMPVLFYAPWALFCTLAGYFADRFSKRSSLVFWKVVEIAITLLALAGFWLGRHGHPSFGSWLVLSTVFLMGMHSAFFVPAKYGAMPEILTPRMLSRGNGVLESLSFLAVILGTVAGGVLSTVFKGDEYLIGVTLVVLALIGAAASLLIRRIPTANPSRPFPPWIYQPLVHSIRQLLTSRPLVFAVIGIAFFTFLVAFLRATVYLHGQSQAPRWSEAETSYIVGMVALGIFLGSPLVGYLSGGKVELGLVPIGASGMVLATAVAAAALDRVPLLIACIIGSGFFTGFYLVPLFSLLQHRAPKTSKGDAVATSNLINITGAIVASLVLWVTNAVAIRTSFAPPIPATGREVAGVLDKKPVLEGGEAVEIEIAREYSGIPAGIPGKTTVLKANEKHSPYTILHADVALAPGERVVAREYRRENVTYVIVQKAGDPPETPHDMHRLPALLFLGAGAMTLLTLLLLWWQLPDLFRRTWLWLRGWFTYKLEIAGMLRLPANGPAILVTDAVTAEQCARVLCATDRVTHFLLRDGAPDLDTQLRHEARILEKDGVVGLSLDRSGEQVLAALAESPAPILPVHYDEIDLPGKKPRVYVVAGALLPAHATIETIRGELQSVHDEVRQRLANGEPLEKEEEH